MIACLPLTVRIYCPLELNIDVSFVADKIYDCWDPKKSPLVLSNVLFSSLFKTS